MWGKEPNHNRRRARAPWHGNSLAVVSLPRPGREGRDSTGPGRARGGGGAAGRGQPRCSHTGRAEPALNRLAAANGEARRAAICMARAEQ